MLYITLNIITCRISPDTHAPPCSGCSLTTTRQSKVSYEPWFLTCCGCFKQAKKFCCDSVENKIHLPKHNLLSHFGCCGSSCCCSKTEQLLCQSDLVQHISCLQLQSVRALTMQWFNQTWILAKTKCNGLRGCTQSATTVPRTCNNPLCSGVWSFPSPQKQWSGPAQMIPSPQLLVLITLQSGSNPTKKQAVRKKKKLYDMRLWNSWLSHQRLCMQ